MWGYLGLQRCWRYMVATFIELTVKKGAKCTDNYKTRWKKGKHHKKETNEVPCLLWGSFWLGASGWQHWSKRGIVRIATDQEQMSRCKFTFFVYTFSLSTLYTPSHLYLYSSNEAFPIKNLFLISQASLPYFSIITLNL